MHRLHLPSAHSDSDLVLAGRLAEALDSENLYVVWSQDAGPYARPEVHAVLHDPVSPFVDACARLVTWLSMQLASVVAPRRRMPRDITPAPATISA